MGTSGDLFLFFLLQNRSVGPTLTVTSYELFFFASALFGNIEVHVCRYPQKKNPKVFTSDFLNIGKFMKGSTNIYCTKIIKLVSKKVLSYPTRYISSKHAYLNTCKAFYVWDIYYSLLTRIQKKL